MPFLESTIRANLSHRTRNMAEAPNHDEVLARFDELSVLEAEFDDAELEISTSPPRGSHALSPAKSLIFTSPQVECAQRSSLQEARRNHRKDPPLLGPCL